MSGGKRARPARKGRKAETRVTNDASEPKGKLDLPTSAAPILIVLLLVFMAGGCYLLRDLHTSLVIGEICHRGCKTWDSNWWAMFWETAFLFMLLFFDLCLVYGGIDGLIRMAKGGGRSWRRRPVSRWMRFEVSGCSAGLATGPIHIEG